MFTFFFLLLLILIVAIEQVAAKETLSVSIASVFFFVPVSL